MENSHSFAIATYFLILCSCVIFGASVSTTESPLENGEIENSTDASNETQAQDLYIIKTIVYEVGILTDAGNDTEDISTHEAVEVSVFDPVHNGTTIDLSNIPLPIQTNVSGVTVTGLLKTNLGTLKIPEANNNNPLLPHKQITVRHNISTTDPASEAKLISQLTQVLGLPNSNKGGGNASQDAN